MKCARCGHDSKYKERSNKTCPKCNGQFAFELRDGGKFTDMAFHNAIEAVSAKGQIRWGAEHLRYELAWRMRPKAGCALALVFLFGVASLLLFFAHKIFAAIAMAGAVISFVIWRGRRSGKYVPLSLGDFNKLLKQWIAAHGQPKTMITRAHTRGTPAPARRLEADIGDYSFDRAVICDRARTADILLANNFHFENNCAVLAVDGYPEAQFETVRAMLKRNPHLRVFALHDATPKGCLLAHKLATDPAWFAGQAPVTDVGLRPAHVRAFTGMYQPHRGNPVELTRGISEKEAAWLSVQELELAVIRPEQVLKRLYKAMTREQKDDGGGGDGGDGGGSGGGRSGEAPFAGGGGVSGGGGSTVHYDNVSFTYEAGDVESDSDGFG